MEAKFEDSLVKDCLTITPDDREEAKELARWDNCIITSKFNYDCSGVREHPTLTLIKEI